MPVRRRIPPTQEVDLDATDELPIVDLAAITEETLTSTDTFILPAVPVGVSELAENLREAENRLRDRTERLAQLEAALEEARQREIVLRSQLEAERAAALERAADMDRRIADADRRLADAERELATVRADFERREDALLGAQVEIDAQRRSLAAARIEVEQRSAAFRHQASDLAELRSRSERQYEALQSVQGWRSILDAQIAEHEQLRQELQRQVDELRRAAPQVADVPEAAAPAAEGPEPSSLEAAADAARAAVAVYEEQQFQIAQLQADLAQSQQHAQRLDEDLRLAEEKVDRLEGELRASASLLGNPQEADARPGPGDTGTRSGLHVVASELPVRLLLREEGGAEIPYALGRRTTIGRTPDNDIQIDTTYISRHHAVVLSNSQDCIIEDLNSTNGVLVNGRRVGRQVLHDGDAVTVGNTLFTFRQPA